jgi:hypothetical protein
MDRLALGIIIGLVIAVALTYVFPKNIRACNELMVKENLAYYDKNGNTIWKVIK